MSEQTPPKPPTSAIPLCNMILGLLIIAQIPVMFGAISGAGTIWLAPWILCAYPVIVFCVIKMFRDGDMVEATINGVLSCVLMGQNAISGLIWLVFTLQGQLPPAEVLVGMAMINGMAFLVGAIILLPMAYLAFQGSKIAGICIGASGIGFLALFFLYYGFGDFFTLIAACGLTILALFLLLSAIISFFPKKNSASSE